jgi:hypothetical protein
MMWFQFVLLCWIGSTFLIHFIQRFYPRYNRKRHYPKDTSTRCRKALNQRLIAQGEPELYSDEVADHNPPLMILYEQGRFPTLHFWFPQASFFHFYGPQKLWSEQKRLIDLSNRLLSLERQPRVESNKQGPKVKEYCRQLKSNWLF